MIAVLAGVPTGDHSGRCFGALAAQQAMFVLPTLVVLEAICGRGYGPAQARDPRFGPYRDRTAHMMLTMAGGNFPLGPGATVDVSAAPAALGQLCQAGVTILAGSDAGTLGVAHGASLHRELQLLVDAGLSPLEALTAATAAPADLFGLAIADASAPDCQLICCWLTVTPPSTSAPPPTSMASGGAAPASTGNQPQPRATNPHQTRFSWPTAYGLRRQ